MPAVSVPLPYRRDVLAAGAASLAMSGLAMAEAATAAPVVAKPVKLPVTLQVNGQRHALTLDTRTTLLDALREHLLLTRSKKGCDHGQCGACTVLLDGQRANACLTLAVMAHDVRITTVATSSVPPPRVGSSRSIRRRRWPRPASWRSCPRWTCRRPGSA